MTSEYASIETSAAAFDEKEAALNAVTSGAAVVKKEDVPTSDSISRAAVGMSQQDEEGPATVILKPVLKPFVCS